MADRQWYDEGTRPRVLINWDTFEDWGIPSWWKGPFTDAVINAYTRWMNVAGVDLRWQFWGYTTKTTADDGELLIKMNEKHADSSRLASTFGSYGRLEIVFHRKRGSDLSVWNFVPYNAASGEFDMQGILMHELGHCLGLDHSPDGINTMFGGYGYHRNRFGPFEDDVARLRRVYRLFTDNRLRQLRSANGGVTWSSANNTLTSLGPDARTNLNLGAVATPGSGFYVVGWSRPSSAPSWLRGDGSVYPTRHWLVYGGERSLYGPAYASDPTEWMLWAWVDNDDAGTIRIVRSDIEGYQWAWTGSPTGATTAGTPGLAWTRVGGESVWILVWSQFDRSDHEGTGQISYSLSRNNGSTWTVPERIGTFYRALSGVSVAADRANHVEIGFSWAPHSTYGMNRIRTFDCLVNGNSIDHVRTSYLDDTTRIQPALAYDATTDHFVVAWRGQNFNTSLNTLRKQADERTWSAEVNLAQQSHVAPALAYSAEYNETVLWHAWE